jgi:hypothetical protein
LLAIHASFTKPRANASLRFVSSSGVPRGCDDFGVSFVPEKGQDYEVAVNTHLRALPRSATGKAVSC